jgi:hypothetical protein
MSFCQPADHGVLSSTAPFSMTDGHWKEHEWTLQLLFLVLTNASARLDASSQVQALVEGIMRTIKESR